MKFKVTISVAEVFEVENARDDDDALEQALSMKRGYYPDGVREVDGSVTYTLAKSPVCP